MTPCGVDFCALRSGHSGACSSEPPSEPPSERIEDLQRENAALRRRVSDFSIVMMGIVDALPREDEVDSVISLLNWTREHHDQDSAARQWLERIVNGLATRAARKDGAL